MHKREEMVGWKGGRDEERVGVIVLLKQISNIQYIAHLFVSGKFNRIML